MKLTVDGTLYDLDIEPEMPLLWVLRDELGLTGVKYGCGIAQCGACTPAPTDEQIDDALSGTLCRCGTYPRIRAAVKSAAASLQETSE